MVGLLSLLGVVAMGIFAAKVRALARKPRERHEVRARSDARLLLLLTPWPGPGHPGTMSLADKGQAREGARRRTEPDAA